MEEKLECVQPDEEKKDSTKTKNKITARTKKLLFAGGLVLLVGIGIVWKCWDGQKIDLRKLSTDELKELREKFQDVLLSPNSDQESKIECINWINVIDNIVRRRDPVDRTNYIYPKGGEHGTNLWKPD